jgi:2',3'-cyclic-nucleotide 2'-phosphodiesterase / 3'-nucleotidase
MLFDNGDIIQGNPLSDYVALPGNFPHDGVHPTIRAMNTMSYDAATIGNHEFNYGLTLLRRRPEGREISFLLRQFPQTRWLALSATHAGPGAQLRR